MAFVFTCLYLWAWFVPMYLWFSLHVLEAFACACELWMVLMEIDLCLCTYDLTSMYFWTLHVPVSCQWYSWSLIFTCVLMIWQACTFEPCMYLWVATMLYRFWKGFGFKPHCVAIVYLPFFVHPHGSIRSFGARKTSARERGQVCQAGKQNPPHRADHYLMRLHRSRAHRENLDGWRKWKKELLYYCFMWM